MLLADRDDTTHHTGAPQPWAMALRRHRRMSPPMTPPPAPFGVGRSRSMPSSCTPCGVTVGVSASRPAQGERRRAAEARQAQAPRRCTAAPWPLILLTALRAGASPSCSRGSAGSRRRLRGERGGSSCARRVAPICSTCLVRTCLTYLSQTFPHSNKRAPIAREHYCQVRLGRPFDDADMRDSDATRDTGCGTHAQQVCEYVEDAAG